MTIFDLIGLVGVAAFVLAYALLQLDRLGSSDRRYLALNGLGSALMLVSLTDTFNLPSFVTQTLWLLFTLVGFWRSRARSAG